MRARDAAKVDPAPCWLWDPARQIAAWANRPAEALFAEIRGGRREESLPPTDLVAALSNACHAILVSAGRAESGPVLAFGRRLRFKAALRGLEDGGAGVLIEVTDDAPDASAADEPEIRLARVAHDLRTPLTAIVGFAEFIAASGDAMPEARRRDYLTDIAEAGRYASRMVEDLLVYAAAGRDGRRRRARADLAEIARGAARFLAMEAERRDIALTVETGASAMLVAANADELRRAVGNLASNAVAHARRRVTIALTTDGDGRIVLSVGDDGPGLAPEELQLALQPFGRLGAGDGPKGAGLGLPIARRFAEMNGARLEIETAPDAGLIARIAFPPESQIEA